MKTLLIGMGTFYAARSWWLKLVGILTPLLMLIAIVATANHFILDAIGGAIVIGLAYSVVTLFGRLRERGYVFTPRKPTPNSGQ